MADTIVNTPATQDNSAGWVVALVIVLAVIIGGFMWYRYYGVPTAPASTDSTNINVTIPAPVTNGTGNGATQ